MKKSEGKSKTHKPIDIEKKRQALIELYDTVLLSLLETLKGKTDIKVNASFLSQCIDFLKLNDVRIDKIQLVGLSRDEAIERELKEIEDSLPNFDEITFN